MENTTDKRLETKDSDEALKALAMFDLVGTTDQLEEVIRKVALDNDLDMSGSRKTKNQNPWRSEYAHKKISANAVVKELTKYDKKIYQVAGSVGWQGGINIFSLTDSD